MKSSLLICATVALTAAVSAQAADVVLNTSLPAVNGNYGAGVATTTTTANGTTTTVVGPGGGANRATAPTVFDQWYQSDVGGGGSVGITKSYTNDGNGAAYFATVDGNSKGDLRYNFNVAPVALSSLTSLSYDFYRDASSSTPTAFAPTVRLDILKDGNFAGSLILEYVYQNQTPAPTGVWTTLTANLNNGIFWANNAALGPTFAAANGGQKTLAAWIADNAGSNLTVYGLSTGAGSGWSGGVFNGAVDHIAFGFSGGLSKNFDFQVAGVPEPASWALMIAGFAMTGFAARRRNATLAA